MRLIVCNMAARLNGGFAVALKTYRTYQEINSSRRHAGNLCRHDDEAAKASFISRHRSWPLL